MDYEISEAFKKMNKHIEDEYNSFVESLNKAKDYLLLKNTKDIIRKLDESDDKSWFDKFHIEISLMMELQNQYNVIKDSLKKKKASRLISLEDKIKYVTYIFSEGHTFKSFFYYRLVYFDKLFKFLLYLISSGNYCTALREMRYILDSFTQSVALDVKTLNMSVSDKYKKVDDLLYENIKDEKRGFDCFLKIINLSLFEKDIIKTYKALCKYIHPSKEEINIMMHEKTGKVNAQTAYRSFNNYLFDRSIDLMENLIAISVYYSLFLFKKDLLSAIPKTFDKFKAELFENKIVKKIF